MSELKAVGIVKEILQKETGTSKAGKDWEKQSFVIDTNAEYNPEICFSTFGKNVSLLNGLSVGDSVEVYFNISSREYNGKYYHNVDAWKINKIGQQQEVMSAEPEDDLPFA